MTISIPDSVFDAYQEGVDWMIDNLGVNAKVVYPPIKEECPNCYMTSLPGVGATNIYKPGGPYSFVGGICPLCNGEGFKEIETSEIIKIRTYFDKKSWNKVVPTIGIHNGDALLIGYLSDMPKLQNMSHIHLASDISGYSQKSYVLSTDIMPWGIKKRRYIYCTVTDRHG